MLKVVFTFLIFTSLISFSQDADTVVFWEYAASLPEGEKGELQHEWGSETVQFLGIIKWLSPSGKELEIRVVSSYRRITKANGFNDQSVLALVKTNHVPIKIYDLVSRQNLPISIRNNKLVYLINKAETEVALPSKFGERLCVEGLNCFTEAVLVEI